MWPSIEILYSGGFKFIDFEGAGGEVDAALGSVVCISTDALNNCYCHFRTCWSYPARTGSWRDGVFT
jgi:hypothetical protein